MPFPCNQHITGSKGNSDDMKKLQPFTGQSMVFKNALDYKITYKAGSVVVDSLAGLSCDTTLLYEKRTISYEPDKISPKMDFEIGYIPYSRDSFIEMFTVRIGNLKQSLIIKNDSLVSFSHYVKVKLNFIDSVNVFDTKLKKVYHLQYVTKNTNEINGFYYSLTMGLMAYYIDEQHYWLRQ